MRYLAHDQALNDRPDTPLVSMTAVAAITLMVEIRDPNEKAAVIALFLRMLTTSPS